MRAYSQTVGPREYSALHAIALKRGFSLHKVESVTGILRLSLGLLPEDN